MPAPRRPLLFAAALLLAAGPVPGPAGAQDRPGPTPSPFGEEAPPPLTPEQEAAARKLFAEGKALLEKNNYLGARRKFQELLKKYPNADEDIVREAEDRSGENCLVGIELQHEGGPPERRIDVELMGDGYVFEKFSRFPGDALNQMKEFWAEPLYEEYAGYFNVWRFDLISAEDGVDELSMEEKMGLPPKEPEPGKRPKRGPKKYSTALNCVAAGGQNQVWADPEQVMRWRRYFPQSDGLTIAFARKGQLGMGGMGIATTGRRVAVVHEFGHAFVGLLDEYAVNPARPQGRVFAPNAVSTSDEDPRKPPPLEEVPWKHWIALGNRQVGLFLGGATYQQGVFRPAASCAMNSGGSAPYCWVCREAGVLRIYSYLSPIDESAPLQDVVALTTGETPEFHVQPMAPKRHRLTVDWFLERVSTALPEGGDPQPPPETGPSFVRDDRAARMWRGDGDRGAERRARPLPEGDPPGRALKASVRGLSGGAFRSTVKLEALDPGVWRLTARVLDDTRIPRDPHPWVVKDPQRLREEWRTWTLRVSPAAAAGPPAPAPGTTPPGR